MNNEREIEVEVENITYNTNSDYENLTNKPSINGVELDGNKTSADLNITDTIYDDTQVRNDISSLQSSKVDKETGKTLSSNDYTNEEKSKLANLSNYDDTQIQSAIASLQTNKANVSDIPDVSNFITSSVDNLVNYYKKNETYTQSEVNNLIGAIQQFHYEIVQTLPQTGETNILYLVPKSTSETQNVYDEYVYANSGWEKIGDTQIDLSDYVTITMLNNALTNYTTTTDLTTLLNAKQDNITSSNKLSSDLVDDTNNTNLFVTSSEKSTWSSKYDKPTNGIPKTDLDSSVQTSLGLADSALQSETYTGTITSVKMNGSTISTSGEADLGTVITQHQDISGKQDVMQYSTMPTADSTTVGKVVQYVGTTDVNYTNGYFYIGTTDGESTPTYSWEQVNVQASESGASKLEDLENVYIFKGLRFYCDNGNQGTDTTNNAEAQRLVDYILSQSVPTSATDFYCYFDSMLLHSDWWKGSVAELLKPSLIETWNDSIRITFYYDHIVYAYGAFYSGNGSNSTISITISFGRTTHIVTKTLSRASNMVSIPVLLRQYSSTQYIGSKYIYNVLPESSVTPTTNDQLVNKSYVDNSILTKTYELSGLNAYSSNSTYSVNDYVYYNNLIYKCNTAVDTAEAFDSTKWTQKTYMEYISDALSV